MKKNYDNYDGKKTSSLLRKELFYIQIDRLSQMALVDDYSSYADHYEGRTFESTHNEKTRIYATIYDLVKLYEGGNRIDIVNQDDVSNIYNLIHRHLHNVNNMFNKRVNQVRPAELEGLSVLGMLADEILENNKKFFTKEQHLELKEQQSFFKPIGISRDILKSNFKGFEYKKGRDLSQHDIVLRKAKMQILDEF